MKRKLIIFDFDDTLFPTTEFTNSPYTFFRTKTYRITNLDNLIAKIFKKLDEEGYDCIIVSNGDNRWLNLISTYLPSMYRVKTFSSRRMYESKRVRHNLWKFYAYLNLFTGDYINYDKYIGVGDRNSDNEAIINACNVMKKDVSFYKFKEDPTFDELMKELEFFYNLIKADQL